MRLSALRVALFHLRNTYSTQILNHDLAHLLMVVLIFVRIINFAKWMVLISE